MALVLLCMPKAGPKPPKPDSTLNSELNPLKPMLRINQNSPNPPVTNRKPRKDLQDL